MNCRLFFALKRFCEIPNRVTHYQIVHKCHRRTVLNALLEIMEEAGELDVRPVYEDMVDTDFAEKATK